MNNKTHKRNHKRNHKRLRTVKRSRKSMRKGGGASNTLKNIGARAAQGLYMAATSPAYAVLLAGHAGRNMLTTQANTDSIFARGLDKLHSPVSKLEEGINARTYRKKPATEVTEVPI